METIFAHHPFICAICASILGQVIAYLIVKEMLK